MINMNGDSPLRVDVQNGTLIGKNSENRRNAVQTFLQRQLFFLQECVQNVHHVLIKFQINAMGESEKVYGMNYGNW